MQLKRGIDRIVILLPSIRIAVKFPIINAWKALRTALDAIRCGGWGDLKMYWGYSASQMSGIKFWLFRGIVANLNERHAYHTNPNPFLQPTYFSLGGLVNLERYGDPYLGDHDALWSQLWKITEGHIAADCHHFDTAANFCIERGVLRMVDYGSKDALDIALVWGEKIVREFDIAVVTAKSKAVL
jgi:hypothetical protein